MKDDEQALEYNENVTTIVTTRNQTTTKNKSSRQGTKQH
jgi:hypothetical protein